MAALLLILVVSDVLRQHFDDDLLLGSATAGVDSFPFHRYEIEDASREAVASALLNVTLECLSEHKK